MTSFELDETCMNTKEAVPEEPNCARKNESLNTKPACALSVASSHVEESGGSSSSAKSLCIPTGEIMKGSPTDSTRASSPSGSVSDNDEKLRTTMYSSLVMVKLAQLALVPDDVYVCQRFSDSAHISVDNVGCRQMVMRMIRMLRLCDYDTDLILYVLSTALVHLAKVFRVTDKRMEDNERVSIAVLQCYNAHCYLVDEACPMKYWQQSIYVDYCDVKVLNLASLKLLKILKFNLSVSVEDVQAELTALKQGLNFE
jgi:hypothetical protein